MFRPIKIHAQRAPWNNSIEFLAIQKIDNMTSIGLPLTMQEIPKDKEYSIDPTPPTFRLDYDEAQYLMDELWNCGLRPSEGTGSAGALAATQRHLEDMRALVFNNKPNTAI